MMTLLTTFRALSFATKAHDGQVRKYTHEPYITHPVAVATLVAEVVDDESLIAAALLHDTVEDTEASLVDIRNEFGDLIARLVEDLTDISTPEDGNRAQRKLIDLRHTERALPGAKTIELADLIHNTPSIVERDPGFAKVYMREKRALLEVLKEGDWRLYQQAKGLVDAYFARTGGGV